MDQIQQYWFAWGAYLALVIGLIATLWVFVDSMSEGASAPVLKALTLVALLLILPSVVLAILPAQQVNFAGWLTPLTLVGILAGVLALAGLVLYLVGVGVNRTPAPPPPLAYAPTPTAPPANYPATPAMGVPPVGGPPLTEMATGRLGAESVSTLETGRLGAPPDQTMGMSSTQNMHSSAMPPPASPSTQTVQMGAAGQEPVHGSGGGIGFGGEGMQTIVDRAQPKLFGYLVLESGVHKGRVFPLGSTSNIGRRGDVNDIVLDDESVSREHARVRLQDEQFVLTDLASANGSFVYDPATQEWRKVHQVALTDKLKLKLGETRVAYFQVRKADS